MGRRTSGPPSSVWRKRILIGAVVAGALLVALLYSRKQQGGFMECGSSVALCGVLTLSSGLGPGKYGLGPGLHGLWPENGDYGSSACVRPETQLPPTEALHCCNAAAPIAPL